MSQGTEYELVLYGATGYTGALTAEHIAKHLPTDLVWAVAGRSAKKLESLAEKLKSSNPDRVQPSVEVAGLVKEDLEALARKTKLIITTVGPYALYGEPVLAACANNGTHYLDVTAEYPWTLEMIRKYDDIAKANGAIIIPQSGLESVPHDLVSWSLVSIIRDQLSVGTKEVTVVMDNMNFIPSGGTLASVFSLLDVFSVSDVMRAAKPWAFSSTPGTDARDPAGWTGSFTDPVLGTMSKSSLTSEANRSVVHRTWGLMGNGSVYGPRFHYFEYAKASNFITASLAYLSSILLLIGLALSPVRWLLKKFVYAPGQGPDVESERKGFIGYRAIGVADQTSTTPARALSEFEYRGSPYEMTGTLVSEAAITILREETLAKKLGGGLLTPATLGQPYVDRLANVGISLVTKLL
ncbi:MAG: hypothetical protein M1837_005012 [Sclerophora amabilis]|nr:MAG: hypothetical protein M1837_005012 [Sclerophora amabilis]